MKARRLVVTVATTQLFLPQSVLCLTSVLYFKYLRGGPQWPEDLQETEFVYQSWGEQKFSSI